MKKELIEQIRGQFAERATADPFECGFYSRDMAPVPALLVDPLFNTRPDIIVRPIDGVETAALLKTAFANYVPVTPRAGASTVYFNSIPVRGGMVIDLNLLTGVEEINEKMMTVRVKAGTTWLELEKRLHPLGLAVKSLPSSAPVATIGGWFSMMGYGIGSVKYGSLLNQVRAVEVALPDGKLRNLTRDTDPSLEWFAAAEGTLGIVTSLELEVRKLNPWKHFLISFSDAEAMGRALAAVVRAPVTPYNVHFADERYASAMRALGFSLPGDSPACMLSVDYEGSPVELTAAQDLMTELFGVEMPARLLPEEVAGREWEEKFNALRLKRGGPSVLGSEIWLPVGNLSAYISGIKELAHRCGLELISYGHVADSNRLMAMTLFYTDETRAVRYILDLSMVKKIHDIGYRYGGYPYGVGLWNTPYLGRIFTASRLKELRRRKLMLDSREIMNPGKLYRPPFILNSFNFMVGMEVLAALRCATTGGGR